MAFYCAKWELSLKYMQSFIVKLITLASPTSVLAGKVLYFSNLWDFRYIIY